MVEQLYLIYQYNQHNAHELLPHTRNRFPDLSFQLIPLLVLKLLRRFSLAIQLRLAYSDNQLMANGLYIPRPAAQPINSITCTYSRPLEENRISSHSFSMTHSIHGGHPTVNGLLTSRTKRACHNLHSSKPTAVSSERSLSPPDNGDDRWAFSPHESEPKVQAK